jgi:hypothetical protein
MSPLQEAKIMAAIRLLREHHSDDGEFKCPFIAEAVTQLDEALSTGSTAARPSLKQSKGRVT